MNDDRIELTGIKAKGFHGVFDHERQTGQDFIVDVTLWLDLVGAAAGDDLSETVDYGELAKAVVTEITGPPVNLIETLADRIARTCLETGGVNSVEVRVHKPQAPVPVEFTDVTVTIRRSRSA